MKIEVEAKLILTVPKPAKGVIVEEIILATEQHINNTEAVFSMLETGTQVGVRIHVSGKEPKVTK